MRIKLIKKLLGSVLITALLCCFLPIYTAKAMDTNSEDQFKKVDEFIETQKEKYNVPALAIGIVEGDEIVYQKGFGEANSEGQPVTPQTPFEIGSVSKSFTALAVMQLVDAGKIDLNATIGQYLPWFKATYKGKAQQITIRQLLHHTSGIKYFYVAQVDDSTTLDQLVRVHLNNKKLNTLPGTKQDYSNANYMILGGIIQEVTGMTYQDYLVKNIFEPLEMKHSYVSKKDALKNNLADGHRKWFGIPVKSDAKDVAFFQYSLPDGYIISCLEDMLHYISALMNQGRYRNISIASPESIKLLFNTEVEEEYVPAGIEGTKSYYGFGWRIVYNNDKLNMYQHSGETAHYSANILIKPEENIGMVQLTNLGGEMSPMGISAGVADIMTGKEPKISNFITMVYIAERVIVFLIFIFLLISFIRLRNWNKRIRKSKANYVFNLIFTFIVNLFIPIYLLLFYPKTFGAEWSSCMLIFPDVAWTVLLTSIILLLIGVAKGLLLFLKKLPTNHSSK